MASSSQFLKHPWELISSLWSAPPNIVPPADFSAAGAPSPISVVPDVVIRPSGLCGWVPSEPGSPSQFVCQAFGQAMPGVVFWVSIFVVTLTAFFINRYWRRSTALTLELDSLSRTFEKMPSIHGQWAKKEDWEKILGRLQVSGKANPPLDELARRMISATFPFPSGQLSRVALKDSVSTIALHVRKSERWSGQSMAEVLPGWLTAIGLLTTFLAILLGLQGVKVLTNLEVRGIGGLVNGLSGKFFSSIVSLGCAISITVIHYFLSGKLNAQWTRLADRLQDLIPHLSVERVFIELMQSKKNEN